MVCSIDCVSVIYFNVNKYYLLKNNIYYHDKSKLTFLLTNNVIC